MHGGVDTVDSRSPAPRVPEINATLAFFFHVRTETGPNATCVQRGRPEHSHSHITRMSVLQRRSPIRGRHACGVGREDVSGR